MRDKIQPARLSLKQISKSFNGVVAIQDVSAEIEPGKVTTLVGPSGAGKTTLLRIIAGLDEPTSGSVELDGVPVRGVPDGLSMVFQDYSRSLFPWMRVDANIALPLRYLPKNERYERVESSLEEVGLAGKGGLYPWQMSGGMQQRVAIARGLAGRPRLLVMDEPFASVDAQTRAELEDLTLRIQEELGFTVLVVTHDIDESIYLADRIVILSKPPSVVAETIEINLERPRDQITTKADPEFIDNRGHVLSMLRVAESAIGDTSSAEEERARRS
jgi:NitT/TauT family transport system ATP-binding protein